MGRAMKTQESVCFRLGIVGTPPSPGEKLGIALTVGEFPINGLRINLEGTCGWFIWAGGDALIDPDFYKPMHVEHIAEYLPSVEPYLSLPMGYRFQIADGYEDVWFDPTLLEQS
jgi:hypothetical protein